MLMYFVVDNSLPKDGKAVTLWPDRDSAGEMFLKEFRKSPSRSKEDRLAGQKVVALVNLSGAAVQPLPHAQTRFSPDKRTLAPLLLLQA